MAERYYQVRPNGRLSGGGTTADIPQVHPSRARVWRIGGRRLAATALVVCLLLTLMAWQVVALQVQRAEEGAFQQRTERVLTTIRARFASAKQAVYGARALIEASQGTTADDWARYVWSVAPFLNEGVVGLGRVERIARDDIEALERRMRAEGLPSFQVERAGDNPLLYVVTGVEPAARNRGALGLDVGVGHHPAPGRRARHADRPAGAVAAHQGHRGRSRGARSSSCSFRCTRRAVPCRRRSNGPPP